MPTFNELVNDVMDRLNLTSEDAEIRISNRINDRYRRVCSSIGLLTSRLIEYNMVIDPTDTVNFPDLPDLDIDVEKVMRIRLVVPNTRPKVLDEVDFDEVTELYTAVSRLPQAWAVKRMGAETCTITLDSFPASDEFTLRIEGIDNGTVLTDDDVPAFPADFHDILVEGAMSDEHRKMEKPQLASIDETNYATRLSDLRMFIAKSTAKGIFQGKYGPDQMFRRGSLFPN